MTFNHITSEFKLHYETYKSCTANLTEVCCNDNVALLSMHSTHTKRLAAVCL